MIRLILIISLLAGLIGYGYIKIAGLNRPNDSIEGRVKALENAIVSIKAELKASPSSLPKASDDFEARIKVLEQDVSKLKSQNVSYSPASSSKSPLYIPLGSGGTAGDKGWYNVPGYEVSIDSADYPGYSGMQLEVNYRMLEVAGVGMARLINLTDNQAVSGELSIAADNFSLQTTPSFKLPSGKKTYRLQIKSTYGANLEIQSARIKVNF